MHAVLPSWPIPLDPISLEGTVVLLETLRADHDRELIAISQDEQIWRYLTSHVDSISSMKTYVAEAHREYECGVSLPFVVRSQKDGSIIGMSRLKEISRKNRSSTIGTWFARAAWGTGANSETKLLAMEYLFERLKAFRAEFHVDSRNVRSRAALANMGAVQEGALRSKVITHDGFRRTTIVFGVLDTDWAIVKERLQGRLARQTGESRPEIQEARLGIVRLP